MKKSLNKIIIVLSTVGLLACKEQVQHKLAVKYCDARRWDTLSIKSYTPVSLTTYKTGLPVLIDCYGRIICINVCEFKTIKTSK